MVARNHLLLLTLPILCGLGMVGCNKAVTTAGPPNAGPPEVSVTEVHPERVVITTELPARTAAYLVAQVRPQVGGILEKRLFEEGTDVKEGDVLYQIDPAPYKATYDNAVAALARAQANLPPIQLKVKRYEEAVSAKAVSQQAYDEALAALKQVEADIEYAKAAVRSAEINLQFTRVAAPISGRIGPSNVTVGALVSAHQVVPLATIHRLDPIYVDAAQSTANLLRLKRHLAAGRLKGSPDQARVTIHLEDRTPYPHEGTLKFSDATVDPTTGSVILRMVFPNPEQTLLPGMYVRARIEEGVVEQAILAPQQGVSRDYKGNPVALVVDAEGKVQQRVLTADRTIGDKWLVSSGLAAGDRVIVEGSQRVRPGITVKAVPFEPHPKDGPAMAQQVTTRTTKAD